MRCGSSKSASKVKSATMGRPPSVLGLLMIGSLIGIFAQTAVVAQQSSSGRLPDIETHGRFELKLPYNPLKLAEENELPINFHGPQPRKVELTYSYYTPDGALMSPSEVTDVKLLHHSDGTTYVNVIPEELGKLYLNVLIIFADGKFETTHFDTEVVMTEQKPVKFYVVSHLGVGTVYMGLSGMDRLEGLLAKAIYETDPNPVTIPAKEVRFRILTATPGKPPIFIDEATGGITARDLGHALVVTTYHGMSALTCFNVMQSADDGSDRTVCHELVPPGMSDPLTGFEGVTEVPKVQRRQPKE